jgi:hypothetical protein
LEPSVAILAAVVSADADKVIALLQVDPAQANLVRSQDGYTSIHAAAAVETSDVKTDLRLANIMAALVNRPPVHFRPSVHAKNHDGNLAMDLIHERSASQTAARVMFLAREMGHSWKTW